MISSKLLSEFKLYTKYAQIAYALMVPQPMGNTKVLSIMDPTVDTEGYIARDDAREEYVIVFRGTQSLQNLISDFTPALVNFDSPGVTPPAGVTPPVKVHEGFLAAYNAVANNIISTLRAEFQQHSNYKIVCTGHSLGGALASICSVSMRQNFPDKKLRLFTFGQPRTGNAGYANFVDSVVGIDNSYRATHTLDGVPTFVPRLLGYEHHSTEYYQFLDPATTFTVRKCKGHEDPFGSRIIKIPLNFINPAHMLYFDQIIGGLLLVNPLNTISG